ncbi:hypothetical protein KL925_004871 [Ogataea polymorpha]|nr:hypothetical protein KL925_004871 [Ogataea polymorpha]
MAHCLTLGPKKMSLGEFYADESLGGSWADDDIDINSIAVSLHKPEPSNYFNRSDQGSFGRGNGYVSNSSGMGGDHMFNGRGGRNDAMLRNLKPPFIAKLTNLPDRATGRLVSDLFGSRFTQFEKCKVLKDPHPPAPRFNISSSGKVERKCAYVQLPSVRELQKVLKWNDVFIDRLRINVDVADFQDFVDVQKYNKEIGYDDEEEEKKQAHTENVAVEKRKIATRPVNGQDVAPVGSPSPVSSAGQSKPKPNPFGNAKPVDTASKLLALENQEKTLAAVKPVSQPKSNPFGAAKPVDVLSKQLEIEKKLQDLAINSTTFKTIAGAEKEQEKERSLSPKKKHQPRSQESGTAKITTGKGSRPDSRAREKRQSRKEERKERVSKEIAVAEREDRKALESPSTQQDQESKNDRIVPADDQNHSESGLQSPPEAEKADKPEKEDAVKSRPRSRKEPKPKDTKRKQDAEKSAETVNEQRDSSKDSSESTSSESKEKSDAPRERRPKDASHRSPRNTRYARDGEPPIRGRGRSRGRGGRVVNFRPKEGISPAENWERGDKLKEQSTDETADSKEKPVNQTANEIKKPVGDDSQPESEKLSRPFRRGRPGGRGRGRFATHQYTSLKYVKPGLARNGEPLKHNEKET